MPIVELSDVKKYLKLEGTTDHDNRLVLILAGVSSAIEKKTGKRFSANEIEIEELVSGGFSHLILSESPIISVTSIEDTFSDDAVTDPDDYLVLSDQGMIYLKTTNGFLPFRWGKGLYRWKVTYKAGLAIVPDHVKQAAYMWIERIWSGQAGVSSMSLGDYSVSYTSEAMPSEVKELLEPYSELIF